MYIDKNTERTYLVCALCNSRQPRNDILIKVYYITTRILSHNPCIARAHRCWQHNLGHSPEFPEISTSISLALKALAFTVERASLLSFLLPITEDDERWKHRNRFNSGPNMTPHFSALHSIDHEGNPRNAVAQVWVAHRMIGNNIGEIYRAFVLQKTWRKPRSLEHFPFHMKDCYDIHRFLLQATPKATSCSHCLPL